MHNVKLIRRRFPNSYARIIGTALLVSLSLLIVGIGLLILL